MTAVLATSGAGSSTVETPKIPIRNLWFLLVYAWDLARFATKFDAQLEASPDLPHLVVRLFSEAMERRLHRNLTRQYVPQRRELTRVRGRIDLPATLLGRTLDRGAVVCRFEDLKVDTPRNRFLLAALSRASDLHIDTPLRQRCGALARHMEALGVGCDRHPTDPLRTERFARHDADDRLVIELARLVLDLHLPTQEAGTQALPSATRDDVLLRRIFERAIGRFYDFHLPKPDWRVRSGRHLSWPIAEPSALLPSMQVDVVLEHQGAGDMLIIDTKFTSILTSNRFGQQRFRSGYVYQLYAYLRSQSDHGRPWSNARGLLLHPALGVGIDESVQLHGHELRFATVDLSGTTSAIEHRLLSLVGPGAAPTKRRGP